MAQKKPKEVGIEHLPMEDDIMTVSTGNYQEKFLYGKSIEAIDYNIGIKNKPTLGNLIKVGTFNITATGSLSITGVGFKPSSLRIVATKNGVAYPLYSDGTSDGTNTVTYRQGTNPGFAQYIVTDNIVSVSDFTGTWNETFSSFVSFDTDGFTLNTIAVSGTVNCYYIAG